MSKNFVIVIAGPTASGKTALGIEIAKRVGGEIISADSMQIYKDITVATAKPTEEEMHEVKHHLVDFLPLGEKFSVAKYKALAQKKIDEIFAKGKTPVIVGGTGLYIDSLLNNTAFCDYEKNDVRQKIEAEADKVGIEKIYEHLKTIDPEAASKLHLNDRKRIIRALEVYYLTGKTISEQNALSHAEKSKYAFCLIGLNAHDRQFLYDRINRRVDFMLENGLIEEAKRFYSSEISKTAAQAIGYKELKPYLDGEISLEEATEKLKMETRRYAKRQLTWFRRYKEINWVYIDEENITEKSMQIINDFERKCVNGSEN
ncbi:MAG: tRNA (adenosine(37)-N6)-dimethylallyltransferase MiaA [Acutalibacteraceae bacterium]